jgi:hypothetical protein
VRLRFGLGALALTSLAGAACLPTDTRTPPASIFLTVTSADQPLVTTADGWSIVVDRLLLGIGGAGFLPGAFDNRSCNIYSEARYFRLLDARLPTDQKVSTIFGLGRCNFSFAIGWPSDDTLLGENVTQADKDLMAVSTFGDGRLRTQGIAIDFAATATRGPETKQVRWKLRQGTGMTCSRTVAGMPSQPFELESEANLAFPIGIRGAALFADNASPDATLRFDSIAAADTVHGNADGEITLDEVAKVTLNVARQYGPYKATSVPRAPARPDLPGSASLTDYIYGDLLPTLVRMREGVTCAAGFRPSLPPSDASVTDTRADEGDVSVDEDGAEE